MLAAVSSVTAALSVDCRLTGAVNASGSGSDPALQAVRDFSGVVQARAGGLATLQLKVSLTGAITGEAQSSLSLAVTRALTGNLIASAGATASMLILNSLAASSTGRSQLSAQMRANLPLSGRITGLASGSAGLALQGSVDLAATAAGNSGSIGVVHIAGALAGQVLARSSILAAISRSRPLAGTVTAESIARAVCTIDRRLAVAIAASAQSTSQLGVNRSMAVTITALSTESVSLGLLLPLSASSTGTAAGLAELQLTGIRELVGLCQAHSSGTATLSLLWRLQGRSDPFSILTGTIVTGLLMTPLSIDVRSLSVTWHDERTIKLSREAMTAFSSTLKPIVRGDTRRIQRTFTSLPTGYTISAAWLTIKSRFRDTDNAALIQKSITTTNSQDGQITDSSTLYGSITLRFDLTSAETLLATAGVEYLYDIQVRTTSGEIHTLAVGTLNFHDGVTIAA